MKYLTLKNIKDSITISLVDILLPEISFDQLRFPSNDGKIITRAGDYYFSNLIILLNSDELQHIKNISDSIDEETNLVGMVFKSISLSYNSQTFYTNQHSKIVNHVTSNNNKFSLMEFSIKSWMQD